jgi:hypothetical protein
MSGTHQATGSPFTRRRSRRGLWMIVSLVALFSLAPLGFLTYRVFAANGDLTVTVYNDTDRDGVLDATDTRFPNANVQVYNRAGFSVRNNTTNSLGQVTFAGLTVGEPYRLEVTSTGLSNVISIPGPDNVGFVSFFTAKAGGDSFGVGLRTLAGNQDTGAPVNRRTVVSRVWQDLNGDGIQDADEPGFAGLTVTIVNGSGVVQATAAETPAGSGNYVFLDTAPSTSGFYLRIAAVPTGYRLSRNDRVTGLGNPDYRDSDATLGTGGVVQKLLPAPASGPPRGNNIDFIDVGFARGGVSGFVWRDLDGNGLRNNNEPKLDGATVQLFQNGTQVATTTTGPQAGNPGSDNAGYYEFIDLDLSLTYEVRIPASEFAAGGILFGSASPANPTPPFAGEADRGLVNGTDAGAAIVAPGYTSIPIDFSVIPSGESQPQNYDETAYFGFFRGSVSGVVFFDIDRDGLRDVTPIEEPAIESVVMCIDSNDDDRCLGETQFSTTDADGLYTFEDLPFGQTVKVAISEVNFATGILFGYGVSTPPVTGVAIGQFNPGFAYRDLAALGIAAPSVEDFDFGITRAEIGNFVFEDANGNGLFDPGDTGLAGVQVDLYNLGADSAVSADDTVVLSTTTNASGIYTLTDLLAEEFYAVYTLTPAQQAAGYVISTYQPTGYPGVDAPAAVSDDVNDVQGNFPGIQRTDTFTITAGSQNPGVDAAAFRSVQVTGKVFFDTNDDALDLAGAEPGMGDIQITLTNFGPDGLLGTADDLNFITDTANTTNTLPIGTYGFTSTFEIPPGTFIMTVTNPLPADFQFVDPDQGDDATDSDFDATGTITATFELASGESADFDAGFTGTTPLQGNTFLDADGDGLQAPPDTDLDGVTVALSFTLNYPAYNLLAVNAVRADQVSATGVYTFENLPSGVFDLTFTPPDATYTPTLDDVGTQPNIADSDGFGTGVDQLLDQTFAGGTAQERDKGYVQLLDISGRAFYDLARPTENVDEAGETEPGLAGLTVTLFRAGANGVVDLGGDDQQITATTSITGFYQFIDQRPGAYAVQFENPASAGFDFVVANQGGDEALDSDVTNLALGQTDILSATSGVDQIDVDAGYIGNAAVSGYSFEDVDGDGLQSALDADLEGVTVTLTLQPAFAGLAQTFNLNDVTDATGVYSFSLLPAGSFDLTFAPPTPPAYQPTFADVGTQPSLLDSDGVLTGTDQLTDQTLASEATEDRDQGYVVPLDIAGRAFYDLNESDTDEATPEPGLQGLTVTLFRPGTDSTFNTTDDVSFTLTTDVTGAYSFTNQVPGNYIVQFENPPSAGFDFVAPDIGGDDTLDSDVTNAVLGQTAVLSATSGTDASDVDAGYIGNATINGYTFEDGTGDGLSGTAADLDLQGVTVTLTLDPLFAGLNLTFNLTDTTVTTGTYDFGLLPAGTFSLAFTPPTPPAYQVTVADVITPTSLIDSDGTGTLDDQLTTQTLDANGVEERDQGYIVPLEISGRAFYDLARPTNDADETGETEPGLAGLTVTLFRPGPNGTFEFAGDDTTVISTTDATGAYTFSNQLPGSFVVQFEDPAGAGLSFVLPNVGADDTLDSDVVDTVLGRTAELSATSGVDTADIDAGYLGNSVLNGYTFQDGTGDGLSDTTGDQNLADVDVTFVLTPTFAGLNFNFTGTDTTDATGVYSFTNLPAGSFTVVFTPTTPPAYQPTLADAGTQPALNDSDGTGTGVDQLSLQTLGEAVSEERDQGYVVPITVEGRAFYDATRPTNDADETGETEPGLGGIIVSLIQAGPNGVIDIGGDDTFTTTTTLAVTGEYSFTNVLPGPFVIAFQDPVAAGFDFVLPNVGDDTLDSDVSNVQALGGFTAVITATSGTDIADVDAGYIGNAAVGGYTFLDGTGDGLSATAADQNLAGVTVTLTLTPTFAGLTLTLPDQVTDATGTYSFTNLPAGSYSLVFTPTTPPAYQPTIADVGTQPALNDSDGVGAGADQLLAQTLAENADDERDQGYILPVTISGRAFYDLVGPNSLDETGETEPGLETITVTLYLAGPNGAVNFGGDDGVLSTTTTITGYYEFVDQPPGLFGIEFDNPAGAGFDFVTANAGDDTLDSDVVDLVLGRTAVLSATSGVDVEDVDAGYLGNAALGGYTFVDGTGDGLSATPNDSNLAGVTVTLTFTPTFAGLDLGTIPAQVTDATGTYSYTNLPAGTFTITFTEPAPPPVYQPTLADVGTQPATNDSDGTGTGVDQLVLQVLAPNEDAERDQGYISLITIQGRAFYDQNNDDVDTNEPGIAGLDVTLYRAGPNNAIDFGGDDITTVATTDATGVYSFENQLPGAYGLIFENPPTAGLDFVDPNVGGDDTVDSDVTDTATGSTGIRTAISGVDEADVDAGYLGNAGLGGYTFLDGTADGLSATLNDSNLAGVTVTLTFTPTFAGLVPINFNGNQLTDATGTYSFTNLPAGTFNVDFAAPTTAAYQPTLEDVGPQPSLTDSDGAGVLDDQRTEQDLLPNANIERDQGFYVAIDISGRAFFDANNNDLDDSEPGLEGLTVTLYLAGENGAVNFGGDDVIDTTLTDATGAYTFSDQLPQLFVIEVENPVGADLTFVQANIGGDDTIDSDITDTATVAPDGRTDEIAPTSGTDVTDVDAGFGGGATVSGEAFIDGDYDGQSGGANDGVLADVTVVLTLDPTFAGLPVISVTQVTAVNGTYSFGGLPGGTFSLGFDPPAQTPALQPTLEDVGPIATDSDGGGTGADQLIDQPLAATATEDRDQGYYQPAQIVARVFDELTNVDNTFQPTEAGIPNITVELDDLNSGGANFVLITDATGVVTFEVPPGNYQLLVPVDPPGYFPSPGNTGVITVGQVLSGQLDDDNGFGYYKSSTLNGSTWFDGDGDGTFDPTEPGMEGITVTLILDLDGIADNGDDQILEEATSTVTGSFTFASTLTPTGVLGPNAVYRLRFGQRTNFNFATLGNPLTADNNSDAGANGLTAGFSVGSNGIINYVDAGYVGTLSVGDLVWEDSNANGLQDTGEQALAGAVVTANITTTGGLINSTNPTFVISTTSTAAAGLAANYGFNTLPPGSGVSVTSVTIFGFALSPANQGTDDALDSDPVPSVGATAAPTTTLDFGLYRSSSLGDRVWLDTNGNGRYDAGTDTGFGGVVVRLFDGAGTLIAQTTSANTGDIGFYQFNNVTPGQYSILFVKPNGFDFVNDGLGSPTVDNDNDAGLDGRTEVFTAPSGQSLGSVDAGLRAGGTITGVVWRDDNNNSLRDASDTQRFGGLGVTLSYTPTNTALVPFTVGTTTAADGTYSFAGLPPGTYRLVFNIPAGLTPVAPNAGDDSIDSDGPVVEGAVATSTVAIDQGFRIPLTGLYLPMVFRNDQLSDLVVVGIDVTPANPIAGQPAEVTVTVRNQGQANATNFWVDFYINPSAVPQTNNPWNEICDPALLAANQCYGLAWYYEGVLRPGESVVLVSRPQDAATPNGFRAESSIWPGYFAPGSSQLYALADSWNRSADGGVRDPNGAVTESDETNNRAQRALELAPGLVENNNLDTRKPGDLSTQRFNR